jgi:hypothetical protein
MTPLVGLLGVGLIIALSVKLDAVDKDAQKNMDTWNELMNLKKEVQELKENKQTPIVKEISPEEAKIEEMKKALENVYRSKTILYPLQVLELTLKEKEDSGKTRQQAIEELYSETFKTK